MSAARLILITLICATPPILLMDGTIVHGLIAAFMAIGIAVVALTIRPGEAGHLVVLARPIAIAALVPALWMLIQIMPLKAVGLAHPIWDSAETALGHPIIGSISIDPGATLMALGQYLSILAVAFLAGAVAVDRERAEWILFALVAATSVIAVMSIAHEVLGLIFLVAKTGASPWSEAKSCVAIGVLVSAAALVRTIERHETSRLAPDRPMPAVRQAIVVCAIAGVLCLTAIATKPTNGLAFALGFGVATLLAIVAIRRFAMGWWGISGIAATALAVAIFWLASQTGLRVLDVTRDAPAAGPVSPAAITQRILADAPLAGTGAGTLSALMPIYRDIGDAGAYAEVTSPAATIAIELGRPMLWLIVTATFVGIGVLLRGALQRGRDSFYPALGASCLVTLLLLGFQEARLFGSAVSIIAGSVLGLAFTQRKSRAIQ